MCSHIRVIIKLCHTGIIGEVEAGEDGKNEYYIWTHKKFDIGYNGERVRVLFSVCLIVVMASHVYLNNRTQLARKAHVHMTESNHVVPKTECATLYSACYQQGIAYGTTWFYRTCILHVGAVALYFSSETTATCACIWTHDHHYTYMYIHVRVYLCCVYMYIVCTVCIYVHVYPCI